MVYKRSSSDAEPERRGATGPSGWEKLGKLQEWKGRQRSPMPSLKSEWKAKQHGDGTSTLSRDCARKEEGLGRRQGQELLQMISKVAPKESKKSFAEVVSGVAAKEKLQQQQQAEHRDENVGEQMGKELLRMIKVENGWVCSLPSSKAQVASEADVPCQQQALPQGTGIAQSHPQLQTQAQVLRRQSLPQQQQQLQPGSNLHQSRCVNSSSALPRHQQSPVPSDLQHSMDFTRDAPPILSTAPLAKSMLQFPPSPVPPGTPALHREQLLLPPALQPSTLSTMPLQMLRSAVSTPSLPLGFPMGMRPLPPPAFTPPLLVEQSCHAAPPPPLHQSSVPGALASQEALLRSIMMQSVDLTAFSAPERPRRASLPLPVGLQKGPTTPPPPVFTPRLPSEQSDQLAPSPPECSDSCARQEDVSKPVGPISRSSSGSCLDLDAEESEREIDAFVPKHCLQALDYPLSKNEKRLVYTRLCDQERAAAVLQYKDLKRRSSMGQPCDDTSDESECDDEDDQKLREKQRELERELQEVRTERRRLSRSSRPRLSTL